MARSIVSRLTTWYAGSLFILLSAALLFSYYSLSKILEAEGAALLRDRLESIIEITNLEENPIATLKYKAESSWPSRKFEHLMVRIVDENGTILGSTATKPADLLSQLDSQILADPSDADVRVKKRKAYGERFLVLDAKIGGGKSGHKSLRIIAALGLHVESSLLLEYRKILIALILVGLIAAGLTGTLLASLLFSPVQKIIQRARELRSSSLHLRLNEVGLPLELEVLSKTINEMLDHLEESFGRLSQFSSNLAHEIRTPINNIRGEIEVALSSEGLPSESSELLLSVNEEVTRISAFVDNLLFVAKSEDPSTQLVKSELNVYDEVLHIFDVYEAAASEKMIRMEVAIEKDARLTAERTLFQRAVNNLLANAIQYTDQGGTITATFSKTESHAILQIKDSGCGIASENLPKLFDRFFRVDQCRKSNPLGGFGLGLTIVRSIMNLHRGTVKIESEIGQGTTASLEFPAVS